MCSFSQTEIPELCDSGSENTCQCETAPVLCTLEELHEYEYDMSTFLHPEDGPEPMCTGSEGLNTASHNPTWFSFIAWCEELTIELIYFDCTDEQSGPGVCAGIQAAVYEDCSLDPASAIACDTSTDGCDGDDVRIVEVTGMIVGNTYHFLVDGCCGSACMVKTFIIGDCGVNEIQPWDQEIQGPSVLCEPGTGDYSVTSHDGAVNYYWYVDGVEEDDGEELLTFSYDFPAAGEYEICVDVDNPPCIEVDDAPDQLCKTVVVLDAEADAGTMDDYTACPGEEIMFSVDDYAVSEFLDQWVFVTDDSGEILYANNADNGVFTHEYCATFNVYSYNFYIDSTFTIPVVGENYNDFEECNSCFCDIDMGVLTFEDTEIPVFDEPPGDMTFVCFDELPPMEALNYGDNCMDPGTVDGVEEGSHTICDGGSYTRTWTIVDSCGNVAEHVQNITIEIVPPAIFLDIPDDENLSCADLIDGEVPVNYSNSAMGSCLIEGSVLGTTDDPIDACGGTVTFTWTFTDDCGREISESQLVTIDPPLDVTFNDVPEDITITCDELPFEPVDVNYSNGDEGVCLIDGTAQPATDGNLLICGDELTVTWSITDDCGRTFDTTQVVTLEDTEDPTFDDTPADETYECHLDIPTQEQLAWSDNCDGSGMVDGTETGTIDPCTGGELTRTWEYTDDCGLTVSYSQTITVNPVPDPDWVSDLPADITLQCIDAIPPPEDLDYSNNSPSSNCLEEGTVSPTEEGELVVCGDQIVRTWEVVPTCGATLTYTQTITLDDPDLPEFPDGPADETFDCHLDVPAIEDLEWIDDCDGSGFVAGTETGTVDACTGGELIRTWEYTDECGNTGSFEQTITVNPVPDVDWTSTLPEDISVQCGELIDPAVPLNYSNDAVSACLEQGVAVAVEEGELLVCGDQIIRTWEVVPDCGATLTHTQTITLEDTELPVFINPPGDATYDCAADVPDASALMWEDNCDGDGMVDPVETGTIDDCLGGEIMRTWEYTDACDNTATHIQTITVNPVPDIMWTSSLPADISVQCGEAIDPPVDLNYSNEGVSTCLEEGSVSPMEEGELLVCGDQITRTWEVVPICGPTLTHVQTITLEDMEAPELAEMPTDLVFDCYLDVPDAIDINATDNCDEDQLVVPTETGTIEDCIGGMITRTWEVSDECGNITTHSQNITVNPVPDIMWTGALPSDLTVQCDDIIDLAVSLDYSNNAVAGCLEEGTVDPIEEGELVNCGDQLIRTWEVVPICGATLTHVQTITLEDITPPMFINTPDAAVTITCLVDLPDAIDLEYEDNCDPNNFASPVESGTLDPCTGGSITRVWEATDNCGNGPITFTQVITLVAPTPTACDDMDECTINDMWVVDCEGTVCVPCTGDVTDCTGVTEVIPCDDMDECTINDMVTIACDGSICVPCAGELTNCDNGVTFEIPCDDGDPCTNLDVEVVDCQDNICIPCEGKDNPTPDPDVLPPDPVCIGENGEIEVIGCIGGNVNWYDDAAGTNLVNVGNVFILTGLTEDATFWVECDLNGCFSNLVSVTVTVNEPITTTITGDEDICEGETSILDAGDGFISYEWDGPDGQIYFATETGNYEVTVTDINGCTSTADFFVTVHPAPEIQIGGSTSFCTDGSTVLSVDDGYAEYQWTPGGESGSSIDVSVPGDYTVVVTDDFGCTGSSTVEVIESTELNPEIIGGPGFCLNSEVTLSAGQGFATYEWAPNGETDFYIDVTIPGMYTVTVSDVNGCTGSSTLEVFAYDTPWVEIYGNMALCPGESFTLDGYDGSNLVSWEWNTGDIGPEIDVEDPGEYTVTATDDNGCTATSSVIVYDYDAPEPEILGDPSFCPGGSASLYVPDFFQEYQWSLPGADEHEIDVDMATTVSVTVTDANGCTGTSSIFVTVEPEATVIIGGSTSFCTDGSTLLDAGVWASQVWQPNGEITPTLEVFDEGDYTVIVTDENGCTASSTVSVTEETELSPVITGDLSACIGSDASLFVSGNFSSIEWSTGDMTSSITGTSGNTYSVTVTDINGCSGSSSVEVMGIEAEQVIVDGNTEFCAGSFSELSGSDGFVMYEWSNGVNDQSIFAGLPGLYSLTATDDDGCTSESSIVVEEVTISPPEIDGVDKLCVGESLDLSIVGSYAEYEWNDGSMESSLTVNEGGTYIVTVTDDFGCTSSSAVIVDQFSLPTVSILGSSSYCVGGFTTLTLNTEFANVMWGPLGQNTNEIQVSSEGTYQVTVTDENGCTATSSIDVTEEESLSPTLDGPENICQGATATLSAGIFSTYEWSTGDMTPSIEIDGPGSYSVTVYDQSGCSGNTSISVGELDPTSVTIEGDPYICVGSTTELTIDGNFTEFAWSNGFNTSSVIINEEGNYGVTVTDENGCTASSMISINTEENPEPEIDGDPFLCPNTAGTFGLTETYSLYEWSTGESTPTITISDIGLYAVTVADANGCTASTNLEIFTHPPYSINIAGSTSYCPMGFAVLDGSGENIVAWSWSNGSSDPTIQVNEEGEYSVTVTDVNGCTAESSVMVTEEESLNPVILGNPFICEGANTTLDAGSFFESWIWSTGEETQTILVTDGGVYSVTVSDGFGCTGEGSVEVFEAEAPDPVIEGPEYICRGETATLSLTETYQSYDWSTGGTNPSVMVSEGGLYTVYVTDIQGCRGLAEFELVVEPSPEFVLNELDCAEDKETYDIYFETNADEITAGTFTIDNIGPNAYLIAEVDTSETISIYLQNTSTGCDTTILVEAPDCACQVIADPGPNQVIDCENNAVALGGTETSEGDGITYEWMDEEGEIVSTDPMFLTEEGGEYTFTVFDEINDCFVSETVLVDDIRNEPMAQIVADPGNIIDCVIDTVYLSYVSEENVVYTWYLDQELQDGDSLLITSSGDIVLVAYDSITHCMTEAFISIEDQEDYPIIQIANPDTLTCSIDTLFIDATNSQSGQNIVYQWYDEDGVAIEGAISTTLLITEPGVYFFEAIDTEKGCSNLDSVVVVENTLLPEFDLAEEAFLPCTIDELTLEISTVDPEDKLLFEWTTQEGNIVNGEDSSNPIIDESGWYYVLVESLINGCIREDSIFVDYNDIPEGFDATIDGPLCAGIDDGTIIVTVSTGGTAPFSYSLNGNENATGVFTGLGPGSYEIIVEDALGCTFGTTYTLDSPDPVLLQAQDPWLELEYNDDVELILNTNVDPSDIDQITWEPPLENPCENCLEVPIEDVTENITYLVTLIDVNGCIDTTQIRLQVDREIDIFIPNVISPNTNDGNNTFYPQTGDDDVEVLEMYIFDRWGELIYYNGSFMTNQPNEGWDGTFRERNVVSGVYVYYYVFNVPGLGEISRTGDVTVIY